MKVLFRVFLALPLLYLPDLAGLDHLARLIFLGIVVGVALLLCHSAIRDAVSQLPRTVSLLLAVILLAMAGTWLGNVLSPAAVAYAGREPDYLGYWAWLVMLLSGIAFYKIVRSQIFSRTALLLTAAALGLSMLFGNFYIRNGLALSGVFYRPAALAAYANIVLVLGLYRLQTKAISQAVRAGSLGLVVIAAAAVLFTQTKLGAMVAAVNLLVWAFYGVKSDKQLRAFLLLLGTIVVVLPSIFSGYFATFRTESVSAGLSYSTKLFGDSRPTVRSFFYGAGPATLPPAINDQNYVPENVIKSLRITSRFSANHDLFYDVNYFFGTAAALALLALNVLGLRAWLRHRNKFHLGYILIFMTLLVNALFTAPSLELTSLYFVVLLGLFAREPVRGKRS